VVVIDVFLAKLGWMIIDPAKTGTSKGDKYENDTGFIDDRSIFWDYDRRRGNQGLFEHHQCVPGFTGANQIL
jgi:hypothetical protein